MTRRPWIVGSLFGVVALALGLSLVRGGEVRLAAVTTDLSARDPGQRHNIVQAATALNGRRLKPGELFSFNATVGPRTVEQGYRTATALMEGQRISSLGGGICQVSSTLYSAAKKARCPIVRRVPHRGRVTSVPPGEDATVWYGGADLVWRAPAPLRIDASVQGDHLIVALIQLRD